MNAHACEILEFPLLFTRLQELCWSAAGRRRLEEQDFLTDPKELVPLRARVAAFRRLLEGEVAVPRLDFADIDAVIRRGAVAGIVFEAEELAAVARFSRSALALKRFVITAAASLDGAAADRADTGGVAAPLVATIDRVNDSEELATAIMRVVDEAGTIRENEIPELLAIKRAINRLRRDIDVFARGLLTGSRDWFQSDVPTERDGRMVLAIKANHRGKVAGVVHESSATGATVYVEPLEVVEGNNKIVTEQNRYRQVILRLLKELSARVVAAHPDLLASEAAIADLDSWYTRARFGILYRCLPAGVGDLLALYDARHPFLGAAAIPVSLVLGARRALAEPTTGSVPVDPDDDTKVLLITGPNTGGKTVALKTVGLFALMNQFGLDVPVADGSVLPIFDDVFADIGDEQSIEQSLSTFSGHIRTIATILEGATHRSLVLLDELGSGTDPEEGVSVAMALLDTFIERGSRLIATTHHGVLKTYGYTQEAVENASMEFDQETLAPTFRVLHGVPGESHALDIAARHGIPATVIERAREYLADERSEAGEIVRRLTEKEREILHQSKVQAEHGDTLREQSRRNSLKELSLRQQERQLQSEGIRSLERFLSDARSQLERVVREIREAGGNVDTAAVQRFYAETETRLNEAKRAYAAVSTELGDLEERSPTAQLAVGAEVRLRSTGVTGTVVRRGRKGVWHVEAGAMRVQVAAADLELLPAGDTSAAGVRRRQGTRQRPQLVTDVGTPAAVGGGSVFELHVRGMRFAEAISALERHIDRVLLSGLDEFAVIHGKGEGILRRGVHDYLRASPLVASYAIADPREGGFGKTIVRLKG